MVNIAINNPIVEHFLRYKFKNNMDNFIKSIEDTAKKEDDLLLSTAKQFNNGEISLGKMAETLNTTKDKATKILYDLDIPMIDYNLEEDSEAIEHFTKLHNEKLKNAN